MDEHAFVFSQSAVRVFQVGGVQPGNYQEDNAAALLTRLADLINDASCARLQPLDKFEVCRKMMGVWDEAARISDEEGYSENARSEIGSRYNDAEVQARTARELIEFTMRKGSHNWKNPAQADLTFLYELIAIYHQIRDVLSWYRAGIVACSVVVAEERSLIRFGNAPGFRGLDFIREREAAVAPDFRRLKEPPAVELAEMYARGGPVPSPFIELNQLVENAFGCSLALILRTLRTLASYDLPNGLAEVKTSKLESDLRRHLTPSGSASLDQIRSVLDLITISEKTIVGSEFDPELARERRFRPYSRPIIGTQVRLRDALSAEALAWTKWPIITAIGDWAVSIVNCVWPYRLNTDDPKEKAVHNELRQLKNKPPFGRAIKFEKLIADEIRKLPGLRVKDDVDRPQLDVRNQIDVLAADEQTNTIWVISAKDLYLSFSSERIKTIRHEFFEQDKNHQQKLSRMLEDVRRHSAEAARVCGVAKDNRQWNMRGAFVTRELSPAAFDTRLDANTAFFTLNTIAEQIRR